MYIFTLVHSLHISNHTFQSEPVPLMLTKVIPWITICLNGVIQPAVLTECKHLTIWVPSSTAPPVMTSTTHISTTYTESSEEHEDGDPLDKVDQFLKDNDTADQEGAPDWEFEEGKYKSKDPNYIFCPIPLHKPLLHLFTKHFCQHPILHAYQSIGCQILHLYPLIISLWMSYKCCEGKEPNTGWQQCGKWRRSNPAWIVGQQKEMPMG